tara:strand:- start:287 stop:529 length:243 start_codon:yes stop_codon:yes gene_type:complete
MAARILGPIKSKTEIVDSAIDEVLATMNALSERVIFCDKKAQMARLDRHIAAHWQSESEKAQRELSAAYNLHEEFRSMSR